jgi:hypothetical protein
MVLGPLLGGLFISIWGERDGVRLAFGAALVMDLAPDSCKAAHRVCLWNHWNDRVCDFRSRYPAAR